jgi:UDP-N-acetylglucosamine 2-epimerase (non-hydrolysing)
MIKVLSVIGTRPEAIKLAPVLHQLEREADAFESRVVVTGQHREMLEPMLTLFGIKADYDLAVMVPHQSLTQITLSVMSRLDPIIAAEKPDWVLVQGDTTSVMSASVISFYNTVRVGHVEAGLRTFDKYSPFPEEINRRITGVLADIHFAPTAWARANLLREGVPTEHVRLTGNTVVDALRYIEGLDFDRDETPLRHLPLDKRIVVVTAHRHENLGLPMAAIATALRELALTHDDVHIVYPLHMNPSARVHAMRRLQGLPNVSLLAPLGYQEMVWLLHHAYLVVTDSGGLQEEAAAAQTPVLVLRDTTERPEGIHSGIAELVRPNHAAIVEAAGRILGDEAQAARMAEAPCPYGDGQAAVRIADALAARPAALDPFDPIYEHPRPEHPLDALIREATAGIPRPYADRVLAHIRSASDRAAA